MSFLYPTFLFALFTVLIPVIIHLFNFRTHKTVYFSNVQFLKNVKQETKSKSNLKHLLILFMRIFTITAIVFAFAQPFIPSGNQKTKPQENKIGIYIDNSFSTEAESKYGKILEIEKKKALEIANAYPGDTKFLFLTNDFKVKHQHLVSKEQFKDFVLETKTSPVFRNTSSLVSKMKTLFTANTKNKYSVYIISDFQKSSSDIEKIKNDSSENIIFVPILAEKTANLFIDSVWFENPFRPINQNDEINVKLTNTGDEAYTQMPLKLFINDQFKSTGSFNIDAHSQTLKKINFTNNNTGTVNGRIEISDFPITYDNAFYFNYNLNDTNKILIIRENNKTNKFINSVFSNLNYASLKTVSINNIQNLNFNNYNVIISDGLKQINEKLKAHFLNFSHDGGILIILPVINCNTESYNKFFNEAEQNFITGFDTSKIDAERINYNNEILKNVFKKKEQNLDMPVFLKRIIFSDQTNIDEDVLLYSEKNDKLITSGTYGSGKIFTFAQAADETYGNLVYHPLWVALLYNMAFYNTSGKNIYYTIGTDFVIHVKNKNPASENIFHILNKDKTIDIIPQFSNTDTYDYRLFINKMIQKAGHYNIVLNNKTVKGVSLNYNRRESNLEHYTYKELKNYTSDFSEKNISIINAEKELLKETVLNQNRGIRLYKLFLLLTLLFIALEILFIKILK